MGEVQNGRRGSMNRRCGPRSRKSHLTTFLLFTSWTSRLGSYARRAPISSALHDGFRDFPDMPGLNQRGVPSSLLSGRGPFRWHERMRLQEVGHGPFLP